MDSSHKATILVTDDSKVMLRAACKALETDFNVLQATDGEEAWDIITKNPQINVVFSDLSMPNVDGYELLQKIRNSDDEGIAKLPVVIITGQEDDDGSREKVLGLGASDFITKPFQSVELKTRASSLASYSRQVNDLQSKVTVDKVTRLYTEASFIASGQKALAYSVRHNTPLCIVRFDIDRFTEFFRQYGKNASESVLTKMGEMIKGLLRKEDIAARLGLAKFALLLMGSDAQSSVAIIERLKKSIADIKIKAGEKHIQFSVSVGYSSPQLTEELEIEQILAASEDALSEALKTGSGTVVCADAETAPEEPVKKRGPKIDVSAVVREIERGNAEKLSDKQLSAAINTILPLLEVLEKRFDVDLAESIQKLEQKV